MRIQIRFAVALLIVCGQLSSLAAAQNQMSLQPARYPTEGRL